jgi:hypothetical protein
VLQAETAKEQRVSSVMQRLVRQKRKHFRCHSPGKLALKTTQAMWVAGIGGQKTCAKGDQV